MFDWLCIFITLLRGLHLYPVQKSYNQTRLGLEFQIEQNPYTKQTLITKENINISTTTDRHIIVVNPMLSLAYHRQITLCWHRQSPASVIRIDRPPPLDLATSYCFSIGNFFDNQSPLVHLPIYISLTPRYASKDTCPKTASTRILMIDRPSTTEYMWV